MRDFLLFAALSLAALALALATPAPAADFVIHDMTRTAPPARTAVADPGALDPWGRPFTPMTRTMTLPPAGVAVVRPFPPGTGTSVTTLVIPAPSAAPVSTWSPAGTPTVPIATPAPAAAQRGIINLNRARFYGGG